VKTGSNGESLIQKTAVNDSDEDDSELIKKIDKEQKDKLKMI
jgi:hypothetical protein